MHLIAAKGANNSSILIPGEWVQGCSSLSCCLWSSFFPTSSPNLQQDFLKLKRESWLLSEMQIGCDRVGNILYALKLQQLVFASQPNYMSTKKSSSTSFTGNTGYPHDHYYWSSLARTTQNYNQMDDPNISTTHSPVLDRMLLQGGVCPPSNFSVWGHGGDLSFAIQAVVWDCRSWSRSLHLSLQFHQCHLHCTGSLYLCSYCCGCSWPCYRVIHQQGACLGHKILKLFRVCFCFFFQNDEMHAYLWTVFYSE